MKRRSRSSPTNHPQLGYLMGTCHKQRCRLPLANSAPKHSGNERGPGESRSLSQL
jgi:hypothetical protein